MAGHRFNPEKAHKLLDPERRKMLPPEKVMQALKVTEGDIVADLGAGNGFLTIPIAQKTKQTVFAVDIEPKMLELLKEQATAAGVDHIEYVQSDIENINMDPETVHFVVMAFVLHEIPDLTKAFAEIKRILKPGGKGLIIDWEAKEMEMGPPLHERIPSAKAEILLRDHGFDVEKVDFSEANYAFIVTPVSNTLQK